jgi:predicted nuclease of predicted toxin-antitoxin system
MRFLVDSALSPTLARYLIEAGHDAVHVRDRGLATAIDDDVLALADREHRVLLSQDTDFGTLLALHRARRPSFVLFRCDNKQSEFLVKLLLVQLDEIHEDLESGSVIVIEETRVRIRHLPIISETD